MIQIGGGGRLNGIVGSCMSEFFVELIDEFMAGFMGECMGEFVDEFVIDLLQVACVFLGIKEIFR